jgi:hypothetical protein
MVYHTVWDRNTSTTTLIREYHPGVEQLQYGTMNGMYEAKKHDSPLQCAKFELEEEAHLRSENWIPLLGDPSMSVSLDKYNDNTFYPFLALDCENVPNPRAADNEEYILIEKNISYDKLISLLYSGKINIASSYGILLALRKLKEMNLIPN